MENLLASSFFENIGLIFSTSMYIEMLLEGFKMTLIISCGAAIIGLILGVLVAIVRIIPNENKFMKIPKYICGIYTTIIRGTPMALQLFLMAFVILNVRGIPQELVAILAFGFNSGAYVSENIRAGINSVEKGQMEGGRSLGLSWGKTMYKIIMPQAIKNVIPTIGNELIALIKETSIVGMIGMYDLTQVSNILGSGNYLSSYFAPTTVVAIFYLAIVYVLTFIIKKIERRLSVNEKRHRDQH